MILEKDQSPFKAMGRLGPFGSEDKKGYHSRDNKTQHSLDPYTLWTEHVCGYGMMETASHHFWWDTLFSLLFQGPQVN